MLLLAKRNTNTVRVLWQLRCTLCLQVDELADAQEMLICLQARANTELQMSLRADAHRRL